MTEIWKQSPTYPRYEASSYGRIRNIRTKEIRLCFLNQAGYQKLCLCVGNPIKNKTVSVHSIITDAFIGRKPNGLTTDHIDQDKTNNKANNLEYVSFNENMARRNGKSVKDVGAYFCKGAQKWRAKHHRTCIGSFKTKKEALKAYNEYCAAKSPTNR